MSGTRVRSVHPPSGQVDAGDSLLAAAALVVVQYSGDGGRGLLAQHISDDSGHCRACYSAAGVSSVWPCMLWTIAERARSLAGQLSTGGGSW